MKKVFLVLAALLSVLSFGTASSTANRRDFLTELVFQSEERECWSHLMKT